MIPQFHLNEIDIKVLGAFEVYKDLTQLELAKELVVSLRKAYCCIRAQLNNGLVGMKNFNHIQCKLMCAHSLTPSSLKNNKLLTAHFFVDKSTEYKFLKGA